MAKDRAAPFSRKHRRYWIPVLGGMIVIGILNVAIGYCAWPGSDVDSRVPERIVPVLPSLRDGAPPDAAFADAATHDALR
jgi:hypothetical protein